MTRTAADPERLKSPRESEKAIREIGVITIEEFKKAVEVFGFDRPVVTALWNTMESNPNNQDEFETVYALWATGRFNN